MYIGLYIPQNLSVDVFDVFAFDGNNIKFAQEFLLLYLLWFAPSFRFADHFIAYFNMKKLEFLHATANGLIYTQQKL